MRKRYALCVGNNYPGTSAELSGCVNDAWDWSELLTRRGYQVDVLLEATLEQVLEKLVNLVGIAGYGDKIVFTYSGHGSWIPDRDGDEADGRDEVLVMTDYQQGGLLVDDTLQEVFGALQYGTGALILSDSCHSGTVSRFTALGAPQDARNKFLSPTEFMDISTDKAVELEQKSASAPRRTASLISGCGDLEYSYDASFNGRPNGAFTRAAISAYRDGVSLNNWFKAIRTQLPSDQYPQTPQLTSTPYRKYVGAL